MNVYYRIPCASELGCQLLMWAQCRDAAKVLEDCFVRKYSIKSYKHKSTHVVGPVLPTEFWSDADMSGWVKCSNFNHFIPSSSELGRTILLLQPREDGLYPFRSSALLTDVHFVETSF